MGRWSGPFWESFLRWQTAELCGEGCPARRCRRIHLFGRKQCGEDVLLRRCVCQRWEGERDSGTHICMTDIRGSSCRQLHILPLASFAQSFDIINSYQTRGRVSLLMDCCFLSSFRKWIQTSKVCMLCRIVSQKQPLLLPRALLRMGGHHDLPKKNYRHLEDLLVPPLQTLIVLAQWQLLEVIIRFVHFTVLTISWWCECTQCSFLPIVFWGMLFFSRHPCYVLSL